MDEPYRKPVARPPSGGKRIRTDQVRYPGVDPSTLPSDCQPQPTRDGGEPTHLGHVRDAGFTLDDSPRERSRGHRSRIRKQRVIVLAVVGAFVAIASVGAVSMVTNAVHVGERRAALTSVASAEAAPAATERAASGGQAVQPQPTPVFASYRNLELHLPVRAGSLTELGFHQAAFTYALPLKTFLKNADLDKACNKHGTGRKVATSVTSEGRLTGYVLRLWRSGRPGRPDTAVDVGAPAGAVVVSPVDGVVLKVKRYKLYGQYDDVQVHIGPDGQPNVDVVLIHLSDVTAKAGERVQAGVTRIGAVRRLSSLMSLELGTYTAGPGDHTHLQLNNIKDPSYKGLTEE